jgi:hypothetical protein
MSEEEPLTSFRPRKLSLNSAASSGQRASPAFLRASFRCTTSGSSKSGDSPRDPWFDLTASVGSVQEQCRACQARFQKKQTTQFSRHERRLAGGCLTRNQMDALVPLSTCYSGLGLCCQLVRTKSPSEVPKRSSDRTTMDSSPPTFTAGMIVPMWSSGEGKTQTKYSLSFIELQHTPVTVILHQPGLFAHKRR